MTEQEREAARQQINKYHREWRKKNKDKVRAINERYWAKKAAQEQQREESK